MEDTHLLALSSISESGHNFVYDMRDGKVDILSFTVWSR